MKPHRRKRIQTERNPAHRDRIRLTKSDIVRMEVTDLFDVDEIRAALEKYNYSEELGYGERPDS